MTANSTALTAAYGDAGIQSGKDRANMLEALPLAFATIVGRDPKVWNVAKPAMTKASALARKPERRNRLRVDKVILQAYSHRPGNNKRGGLQ